jgi:succinoglycan biosynthesis transport protein ExoP
LTENALVAPLSARTALAGGSPMPLTEDGGRAASQDRLRDIIAVFRRRKLPFIAVFIFVLAAVMFFAMRQVHQYTASANLIVNSRTLNIQSKNDDVVPEAKGEDDAVNLEIQIIKSHEVRDRVFNALIRDPNLRFAEKLTLLPPDQAQTAALGAMDNNLAIERPGSTNVVKVSFTAPDPKLAAMIANEYASQYLAIKSDTLLGAARVADKSLRNELQSMRARVEEAEAAVAAYRRDNNLLSANGVTLTEQEQSVYKQQEATAQTTLAEERARLQTARSQLATGSKGDDVGEALGSSVVTQLRSQQSQASTKVASLRTRYGENHPDVIKAKRELEEVNRDIQSEIGRIMSNLEARVKVAEQRESAASGIAASSRGTLAANNEASVRLNELERRAEALRTNYAAMLQRQTLVASQSVVADSDARILSSALVPASPSKPNKKLIAVIGAMLAFVVASATVGALQMFDRTIVSSRQAEDGLGLPHLINSPSMRSVAERKDRNIEVVDYVVARPMSMVAETARSLLLAAESDGANLVSRYIGLTSAKPGEGKSTLAIWLARVSAMGGRKTLLIDGDVRRPSIARNMKLEAQVGFVDVLEGKVSLEDALIHDQSSGAWILPSVANAFRSGMLNSHEQMDKFFNSLSGQFDVVIIDTAPALAAVESRFLLSYVDNAIMVVRWNSTHLPAVRAALKRLFAIGIKPFGVVMTQVNMKAIGAYASDDVDHDYRSYYNYGA